MIESISDRAAAFDAHHPYYHEGKGMTTSIDLSVLPEDSEQKGSSIVVTMRPWHSGIQEPVSPLIERVCDVYSEYLDTVLKARGVEYGVVFKVDFTVWEDLDDTAVDVTALEHLEDGMKKLVCSDCFGLINDFGEAYKLPYSLLESVFPRHSGGSLAISESERDDEDALRSFPALSVSGRFVVLRYAGSVRVKHLMRDERTHLLSKTGGDMILD